MITENVIYRCVALGITLKLNNRAENNIIADILEADDPENVHRVPPVAYFKLREGPMTGAAIRRNILYHPGENAKFYDERVSRLSPVLAQAKDADTDDNIYYCAGNPELSQSLLKKMQRDGVDAHSLAAICRSRKWRFSTPT